jgi:hypothetical protein
MNTTSIDLPFDNVTTAELTPGQKLVGVSFNPSAMPAVDRVKQIAAEMYDIVKKDYEEKKMHHNATPEFFNEMIHVQGEILNAQMNAVKMLTWRF